MIISLIAAMDKNRVIGKNNALPWHLPADLKHFKELTIGKPIIMGRKTFASIGKPLPKRTNIILTRDHDLHAEGCIIAHSLDDAIKAAGNVEEIVVIGGAEIFKQFLPHAQKMYLTTIDAAFDGDIKFPEWDHAEWKETMREEYYPDKNNKYHHCFLVLERIS